MCTPLSIAALGLTAAGAGASYAGSRKADSAQKEATNAEILRQQKYQDESQRYFNQSLGESSLPAANQTLNDSAARNAAAMNAVVGGQDVQAPIADNAAPKVISNEISEQLGKATRYNRQQGTAKGKLDSYGDWNLSNALNNAEASRGIGLQGNLMQGSAGVLPYEMQDAAHKGDNLRQLGTILSSLGSVAGLGASMGVGAGTTAAAPVTSAGNATQTAVAGGVGNPALYSGTAGIGTMLNQGGGMPLWALRPGY